MIKLIASSSGKVWHMAVVFFCPSLLDLSNPPPWMELVAHFHLHKVFCWGRDVQCAASKGQTAPKQPLLNHLFPWSLLTPSGDVLGRDMGAEPHLCVCHMTAQSRGKDLPPELGACAAALTCSPLAPTNSLQLLINTLTPLPWSHGTPR